MSTDYANGSYARLVLRKDGKRVIRYVKLTRDTDAGICVGERVTKDGDTWERETADAVQREVLVWTPADVVKRTDLKFSMRYGTLVEPA